MPKKFIIAFEIISLTEEDFYVILQLEVSCKGGQMSSIEKLIDTMRTHPNTFPYSDLKRILAHFNYCLFNKGKTSGSRVSFVRNTDNKIISFHKPHAKDVKKSTLDDVISHLERNGDLK